jgi:hypothetical protein
VSSSRSTGSFRRQEIGTNTTEAAGLFGETSEKKDPALAGAKAIADGVLLLTYGRSS